MKDPAGRKRDLGSVGWILLLPVVVAVALYLFG